MAAIRSPETRGRDGARRRLVERAFFAIRTPHFGHLDARCDEQVVDVPADFFLVAQMPRDARLERAFGRAGVDIVPRRKLELAQTADSQESRFGQMNPELVGAGQGVATLGLVVGGAETASG